MNREDMNVLKEELQEYLGMAEALVCLAAADAVAIRLNDTGSLARHGEARRKLAARLAGANHRLRQHRIRWERLPRTSPDHVGPVADLVRRNLDAVLRTVAAERVNERNWPRFRPRRELLGTLESVR